MTVGVFTAEERRRGVALATGSYVLWGFIPLYFLWLKPMQPDEITGWRVVFSLVVCIALVLLTGRMRDVLAIFKQPRVMLLTALAAGLIYLNWFLFAVAATTGFVLDASLAYFITPIISVVLGIAFYHERLRWLQWIAFALSGAAVVVMSVMYGRVPWMAMAMAVSFGLYGFVKKKVGARVDAISGLTIETLWVLPVGVVQLVLIALTRGLDFGTLGALNTTLVPLWGLVTTIPMLLFAGGTRSVPMVYLGMLQFVEPTLQFLLGALILQEEMPVARLLGFGLVWVAVGLLVIDSLRTMRSNRRNRRLLHGIEPTLQTGPMQRIETAPVQIPEPRVEVRDPLGPGDRM